MRIAGERRQQESAVTGPATEAAEPGAAAAAARAARRRQGWIILGVTAVLLSGLCAYTAFAVISTKHQTAAANLLWKGQPAEAPKPMAMEQILPFGAGYDFFDRMGGRVYPNGHSMLGVNFSIHSAYAQVPEYEAALRAAHGEARADEILQRSPARRRAGRLRRVCLRGTDRPPPRSAQSPSRGRAP